MMATLLEEGKESWLKARWLMEILNSHVIFIGTGDELIGLPGYLQPSTIQTPVCVIVV